MPDKTPELLPCPFCGGSKLEIIRYWGGYRVMCWECKNESGFYSTEEKAMDAWNRRAQPKPEPLTLEELAGMDGQPVWIVEHPNWGHWEYSEDADDYLCDRDPDFYGMTAVETGMGESRENSYGLHCLGWLAYKTKPEGTNERQKTS